MRRVAISKAVEYLRNACGLFNKITINSVELDQLERFCQLYFNLFCFCFFFQHKCYCMDSSLCYTLSC